ncbi:MAG: glycosyltransferase family 39 protein, partial [Ignavibacteriales bacterium]|nr:glycosyltransferase family 39 protein [Ignavibacteriales bacterium]
MKTLKEHFVVIFILAIFFVAGLLRLNDLSLYTDSTRYLIWGNSVAHGQGFVDNTQPEPEYYVVNAPLYAVILAPVELLFPLSITAAKTWTLLFSIAGLFFFFRWLRKKFTATTALVGVLLCALNPLMLVISTETLSEAPFLLILIVAWILLEKPAEDDQATKQDFIFLLACFAMLPLLREIGAALVVTAMIVFLMKRQPKKALLIFVVSATLFGLWTYRNLVLVGTQQTSQAANVQYVFQHFVTAPDASLSAELVQRAWLNIKNYASALGGMIFFPSPSNLIVKPSSLFVSLSGILHSGRNAILIISTLLIVFGVVRDFRKSTMALYRILFLILYLGIVVVYPVQDLRFLLPFLIFLIYYVLHSTAWLAGRLHLMGKVISVVLLLAFAVPNISCITDILRTNIAYTKSPIEFYDANNSGKATASYFTQPWSLMGNWIKEHVPEGAAIASPVKELAPFIGDRKLLEINRAVPSPIFDIQLRDNQAEYVLTTRALNDMYSYEVTFAESRRFSFEPLYQAASLHLYRARPKPFDPLPYKSREGSSLDGTNSHALLLRARQSLLNEQYESAIKTLTQIHTIEPSQPEPTYHLTIAYSMIGDSINASRMLQRLFTQPQSSAFVSPARLLLYAMNVLARANATESFQRRSTLTYEAASIYWDLGYPTRAYALMQSVLKVDSTYFVGLLWGWHYATQLGDSAQARLYFKRLERIDRTNAVVVQFHAM